jgi:biotin transport system substrate-specific component
MRISTREMVLAGMFTAVMCVITIVVRVFQPVIILPFSLQPLIMLLAACILSPLAAFLSMLAYLCLGLIGMPVFSSPPYGGLAYFLSPSFGFLLAFPIAAWVQANLIRKISRFNYALAGLVGVIIIYTIGLPYMYLILNWYLGKALNVYSILKIGFIPFIFFDLIKVLIASLAGFEISKRLGIKKGF